MTASERFLHKSTFKDIIYDMGIMNFLKDFFGKKDKPSDPTLIDRINTSMQLLIEKSGNLNDSFSEEKQAIRDIAEEASNFVELKDIFSAKLEQDILGQITKASFACDAALSGADSGNVKKCIASLKAVVNQRTFVLERNANA